MGKGGAIINIASIQVSLLRWACQAGCCTDCQARLGILLPPCILGVAARASWAAACISNNADSAPPVQAYQPMYGIMDYASTKVGLTCSLKCPSEPKLHQFQAVLLSAGCHRHND